MHGKNKYIITLAISLAFFAMLLVIPTSCICDPSVKYVIENQTGEELTIFFKNSKSEELEIGKVQPGQQIIDYTFIGTIKLHYVAKNKDGKIVFDKILTREQMQEISSLEYKIVIKP